MAKYVFKGKFLKVAKRRKKLPSGRIANLEVIDHPGAALIIPFLTREKVILIRQLRPVIDQYFYEFPAGTIDPGETPLACAKREIIEEVGYAAKKFTKLADIYPVPGYSTEKISIYKAEKLIKKEIDLDQDEVITPRVFSRREVKRLFCDGKIKDAKTICALAFCGWI